MMRIEYQCCFCGKGIDDGLGDPCGLALMTELRLPTEKQLTQGFYCHIKCFKERLHSSVPLYVEDVLGNGGN
jgi:hypothetical protein